MELRSLPKSGHSVALGVLALGAVQSGLTLATAAGGGNPPMDWTPMPDGKGGTIAPTGKAFALDMITVGIWNRQGTMDEEFLFWDGQTFYQKIGLA